MTTAATHQTPLADVRGKVAFITGGSSGIGLGLGRVFSAAGMKVVFTYMRESHRDAALASYPAGNPGLHAIKLDTADRDGMVRAADEAQEVFGNVHLLANNAGVGITASDQGWVAMWNMRDASLVHWHAPPAPRARSPAPPPTLPSSPHG